MFNKPDIATLLTTEIGSRLLQHLDFVLLKPQVILQIGLDPKISKLLQQRYSQAKIITLCAPTYIHKKKLFSKQPEILLAPLEKTSLKDHSIDFIFANLALNASEDLSAVFNEFHRILKPEGLFLFSLFGPDTLIELQNHLPQQLIDMHNIGDLLMKTGFADPVMDMEKIFLEYSSQQKLLDDLTNLTQAHLLQNNLQANLADLNCEKITIEIVYGHAWGKTMQKTTAGETQIPLSAIKKR